jgi:transcriptional regulator with XRE-family HTH domain
MPAKTFAELIGKARRTDAYVAEWAVSDFTEELTRRMEELGLSRVALAERIGASPPYVTKVLRGDANFTIRSLTKLARAVDSVLRLHLAPIGSTTVWVDEIAGFAENGSAVSNKTMTVSFGGRATATSRVEPALNASAAVAEAGAR